MDISIVIPCYRSENTIAKVIDEIQSTMRLRPYLSYEVILVNDCSPDGVWNVICDLTKNNKNIIGVNLSKNFGQHSALMAGFKNSTGDTVVTLDDDGQTPASKIYDLYDELNKGYDVVYATYRDYNPNFFRKLGSRFANKMTYYMLDVKEKLPDGSSFRIMRRYIVDEIIKYNNPYPYILGLILRSTRNVSMVEVEQRDRLSGKSGYTLKSLFSLWLNGFTAFSVKPLEFGAVIGFFLALLGIIFAVIIVVRKIINPDVQMGWSSLISAVTFIGGVIMIMLGLIGEYVGRIYICINDSPQYVIKEVIGKDSI